jgi:hypothetical protein
MRDIVHRRCCGLDLYIRSLRVSAGPRTTERIEQDTRVFGTTTEQLRSMGDWMRSYGVQLVTVESTGVYWGPVWTVLEGGNNILHLEGAVEPDDLRALKRRNSRRCFRGGAPGVDRRRLGRRVRRSSEVRIRKRLYFGTRHRRRVAETRAS